MVPIKKRGLEASAAGPFLNVTTDRERKGKLFVRNTVRPQRKGGRGGEGGNNVPLSIHVGVHSGGWKTNRTVEKETWFGDIKMEGEKGHRATRKGRMKVLSQQIIKKKDRKDNQISREGAQTGRRRSQKGQG